MKGETGPGRESGAGMIQSLTPMWRYFEAEGFEPRIVADLRPWVVVMHSATTPNNHECWLVCTATTCSHEVYTMATRELPDTLILEECGTVNGHDFMVFCG